MGGEDAKLRFDDREERGPRIFWIQAEGFKETKKNKIRGNGVLEGFGFQTKMLDPPIGSASVCERNEVSEQVVQQAPEAEPVPRNAHSF